MKKKHVIVLCMSLLAVGASADLQHRWSFDSDTSDSVGGATLDIVGGSTVTGGAYDSIGGPSGSTRLEATGTSLAALGSTITGASAISFELWLNQDTDNTWAKVLMTGSAQNNFLAVTPRSGIGDQSLLQINNESPTGSIVLNNNADYYIAGIYDDANDLLTIYAGEVGGTLSTFSSAMPQQLSALTIDNFYIGGTTEPPYWGDGSWDGQVDEVRIWDHALNESQVDANFAAGPNVIPEPATLGLLGMMGGAILFIRRNFRV